MSHARIAVVVTVTIIGLAATLAARGPAMSQLTPPPGERQRVQFARIVRGDLSVLFRDNAESPGVLSGIGSLTHRAAPDFDAFDPDSPGASAGLNFEHIISGHADPSNPFTPRKGPYALYRWPDGRTVQLVRDARDCPWFVAATTTHTLREPHYVDTEFRCTPQDASRFGRRGYAIFFWADYMNNVDDVAIHFRGVDRPGGEVHWIAADAPPGHADWTQGGTYRHVDAPPLEYDADHNFKLNVWSYDEPRFVEPFYYGRAANGMVLMLMFDRTYTAVDEIRFSLFKFKIPKFPRPAWDFQYVIHKVEAGRTYGFRSRLVWKKFVSPDDCLAEYQRWAASLRADDASTKPTTQPAPANNTGK